MSNSIRISQTEPKNYAVTNICVCDLISLPLNLFLIPVC